MAGGPPKNVLRVVCALSDGYPITRMAPCCCLTPTPTAMRGNPWKETAAGGEGPAAVFRLPHRSLTLSTTQNCPSGGRRVNR